MGIPWCSKLPLITVPRCDTPKHVTLIVPFYMNAEFFSRQVAGWSEYPEDLRANLSVIVVDDGSPVPAVMPASVPFSLRMFRIREDRRWNWLAARNIGAHEAADGWLLLTDMDHVVPAETLRAVIYGDHFSDVIYGFSRREHTGEHLIAHPNSWLMTRAMFWKVGGYDERLSGFYGTDGLWRKRCAATAPIHILTDHLVRYEFEADSSTTRYLRKQPEDANARTLAATFSRKSKPRHLTFPYDAVVP